MTVRFRKKNRKFRGKRSRGYGGKKKHRGSGSKGGKGWAGAQGSKKTFIHSYARDHFGYKGFQPPKAVVTEDVIINLADLDRLSRKEKKKELDLGQLGYTKLLAKGKLSSPLTIKVPKASASAKKKVEQAGGKLEVETAAGSEEEAAEEATAESE